MAGQTNEHSRICNANYLYRNIRNDSHGGISIFIDKYILKTKVIS